MDIKELLCFEIHNFVKEHIDEVENKKNFWDRNQTYDELGFKDRSDMLKQIKENPEIAFWALTELMAWGMSKQHTKESTDYRRGYIEVVENFETIYRINDRYFKDISSFGVFRIKEVKKVTKLIEVNDWEDIV